MKKLLLIFYILGFTVYINAQGSDSAKFKNPIKLLKKELTDSQKKDSMSMKNPIKVIEYTGDSVKIDITESTDYYYTFVKSAISEDKICSVYLYPAEAIEEFFKNFTPTVIPEYFLFGVLGSQKIKQKNIILNKEKVLYTENAEHPFIIYVKSYIEQKLGLNISINKNEDGVISFYSPELAQMMNNFFDDETEDLKFDLFNTNEEICSYLMGVYYRCGKKINDEILANDFYLYNNPLNTSFYEITLFEIGIEKLFTLLKKVCSNNILFSSNSIRGAVPGETKLFFEPSIFLEKYLQSIEKEKMDLQERRLEYIKLFTE